MPRSGITFLCVKIKPSLQLSIVMKDRAILLYTMTKGFQFNIGSVIERALIELTQGRCTGALIHPSLITKLCCDDFLRSRCWTLRSKYSSAYPYRCLSRSLGARVIQMRRLRRMLRLPYLVQATLRSPPVRLSPLATRFMRLPHGLTPIRMSLRSTGLP